MKTIIAGKPSVAREIAHIVGATGREEGYSEGGGYAVTQVFGHLTQLAMPDNYGVHGLVRDNLPIIPDTFTLVPRRVKTEKGCRPDSGVVSQIKVIKRLFDTSEQVIVATDVGHKGGFIFRYLYHYTGCTTPLVRLQVSSLIDKATRERPRKLEDGSKYNNLYFVVRARSESGWFVGTNGAQALSVTVGHSTYSAGRVQTPTLVMICERHWENRHFTSEVFWQLHIAADGCDGEVVKFSSSEKWKEKEPAMELYNRVETVGYVTIAKTERKEKTEDTLLLYDLTALRKEANTKHSFTVEQTLETAQELHGKGLITCPRTGNRYIPEDVYAEIPKLLAFIGTQPEWKGKVRAKAMPTHHSVNDGKVTDHRALLVTDEKPLFPSKKGGTLYHMIAGRMVEAFSEKCAKDVTIITTECVGVEFTMKDSVVKQAGWRAIYGEKREDVILPDLYEGDCLTIKGVSITEGRTKPKPLHTEAILLSAMETIGKEIEDDALRQVIKDCGISIPTTRASIIETLFKHDYIERYKKLLVPTEKDLALNSAIEVIHIADVAMTDKWERELARIERDEVSTNASHREIEVYTREIASELLSCDKLFGSRDSGCACPKYGADGMRFYGKVIRCDNVECGLPVFQSKAGCTLPDDEIRDLLAEGHTKLFKGFKNRQGKSFDAVVAFDGEYNTTFVFPEAKKGKKFSGQKKQY